MEGKIYDENGNVIQYYENGKILDRGGNKIGYYDDEKIYDQHYNKIGYYDHGIYYDEHYNKMGYFENGRVLDVQGSKRGYYDEMGSYGVSSGKDDTVYHQSLNDVQTNKSFDSSEADAYGNAWENPFKGMGMVPILLIIASPFLSFLILKTMFVDYFTDWNRLSIIPLSTIIVALIGMIWGVVSARKECETRIVAIMQMIMMRVYICILVASILVFILEIIEEASMSICLLTAMGYLFFVGMGIFFPSVFLTLILGWWCSWKNRHA